MIKNILCVCIAAGMVLGASAFLDCLEPKKNNRTKEEVTMIDNTSKTPLSTISISIAYDNNRFNNELTTAWGFSCFIQGPEKTILFDTGGDGTILLENMNKLDINPEEVDLIVLSHFHSDHTGGLSGFLNANHDVVIYLPKSFPTSFKETVNGFGAEMLEVHKFLKISGSVYTTGEMGTQIIEQALIIHTDKGLIVVTGCAHPGIVDIVAKSKELFKDKVLFVLGGFHLSGESTNRIEQIISDFKALGVQYVGPTHCTGDTARKLFEKEYQDNYINVGAGKILTIKDFR